MTGDAALTESKTEDKKMTQIICFFLPVLLLWSLRLYPFVLLLDFFRWHLMMERLKLLGCASHDGQLSGIRLIDAVISGAG